MIVHTLQSERLGPLPLINHFIERIGLEDLLDRQVPSDARCAVQNARALGVLLRSIIVEREPIYRQEETVHGFASGMFGIAAEEMEHLCDDRLGRALDRLFDADRAALLTDVVLAVGQRFNLKFDEFHNDSTTISVLRQLSWGLRPSDPRPDRAGDHLRPLQGPPPRSEAAAVHPHDDRRRQCPRRLPLHRRQRQRLADPHRDLERAARPWRDGRTSSTSPIRNCARARTWTTSTVPADASSPCCHARGWRTKSFASGSRPTRRIGNCVWDRPNPRYSDGPRDRWYVYRAPLPSAEVWSVVWVWSALLTLRQEATRRRNIAAASEELNQLRERLAGAKTRLRGAAEIDLQVELILDKHHVSRYLKVSRTVREVHLYKQTRRGRPGPETAYRKITKRRFDIEWTTDEAGHRLRPQE